MSRFVALMYHNVLPAADLQAAAGPLAQLSPSITSYFVSDEQFRSQLAAVPADRWVDPHDLRLPAFWNAVITGPPRVLLTLDDGWAGSFDVAGPILHECGARALVFVTTGLLGKPLFYSRRQLHSLSESVFEIGSHTVTHPFLNELSEAAVRRELMDSKHTLEDLLGRPIDCVSIPNGAVNDRVRALALEAGYQFLFTSEVHINDLATGPAHIGRAAIQRQTTPESVLRWACGDLGAARRRRTVLTWPKRLLGPRRYRLLRAWMLGDRTHQAEMNTLSASNDGSLATSEMNGATRERGSRGTYSACGRTA